MKEVGLPPRIDASPEEIARATLRHKPRRVEGRVYRCGECGEVVEWPAVLGDDGVCDTCTDKKETL